MSLSHISPRAVLRGLHLLRLQYLSSSSSSSSSPSFHLAAAPSASSPSSASLNSPPPPPSFSEPPPNPNSPSSSASSSVPPSSSSSGGAPHGRQSSLWKTTKLIFGTSVVAGAAGCAYVTYQYDTETLQKKIDSARASLSPPSELETEARVQGPLEKLYETVAGGLLNSAQTYVDLRTQVEDNIKGFSAPLSDKLLPDVLPGEEGLYTLVLDLNDTLVHSDWNRERGWRTFKRPGVEAFLMKMAQNYEVVVFSDQLNYNVDPILDRLDEKRCVRYRVYRDGTLYSEGKYLKDLWKLNRNPSKILYVTGHPENCIQKENVVPISPWKTADILDASLLDLIPFLEYVARHRPPDTRVVLESYKGQDIPLAFKERTLSFQRRVQERNRSGFLKFRRTGPE